MNETLITMSGNAVEDPVRRVTRNGDAYVTLRLASTVRRRDQDSGRYVDAETNFVTVVAFRQLALNTAESVRKGQPLIVTGRLRVNQWRTEEKSGVRVEIDATGIGHDLSRGVSQFTRVRPDGEDGPVTRLVTGENDAEAAPWQTGGEPAEDAEHNGAAFFTEPAEGHGDPAVGKA
ncbi:single-stranded DNA-binding protein [Austwickia chelonae]|uniref:single-stranded DNA-binding protein n=1 Tax=Austwickia chelonae TaxID=100225 RepID=UPI0013C32619|nr:single-stranded DNA-binding protein [Austwickia chelonae]